MTEQVVHIMLNSGYSSVTTLHSFQQVEHCQYMLKVIKGSVCYKVVHQVHFIYFLTTLYYICIIGIILVPACRLK
jgi:F0F1-type ATP synthase assembly protein I